MLGYIFLAIAIVTEVVATTFLKFTSGDNPELVGVRHRRGRLPRLVRRAVAVADPRRPAGRRLRDLVGGRRRGDRADLVGVLQGVAHLGADRRHRARHRSASACSSSAARHA